MNERLENIIQSLISDWKIYYRKRKISWKHPCKKILYECMNLISDKMFNDIYMKQSQYNLKLLSAIQEISCMIQMESAIPNIFLCEDDFKKENNILDVLLVFKSYYEIKQTNVHLYLAPRCINSESYLVSILDVIEELEIKNIHFLFYLNSQEREKIYKESNIFLSFKNYNDQESIESIQNIPLKKVIFSSNNIDGVEVNDLKIIHSLDDIEKIINDIEKIIGNAR